MICPCCSGELYANCCQPFHSREKDAPTAEALMSSRFAAFAIPNGAYLMETTLPKKRKFQNLGDLREWGEINTWTKMEIVQKPSDDQVEFRAYYTHEDGQSQLHHELSLFRKVGGRWYYVSGKFLS